MKPLHQAHVFGWQDLLSPRGCTRTRTATRWLQGNGMDGYSGARVREHKLLPFGLGQDGMYWALLSPPVHLTDEPRKKNLLTRSKLR